MGRRHGMQMGSSGYGLTHGYGPGDEREANTHEMRGCHGGGGHGHGCSGYGHGYDTSGKPPEATTSTAKPKDDLLFKGPLSGGKPDMGGNPYTKPKKGK